MIKLTKILETVKHIYRTDQLQTCFGASDSYKYDHNRQLVELNIYASHKTTDTSSRHNTGYPFNLDISIFNYTLENLFYFTMYSLLTQKMFGVYRKMFIPEPLQYFLLTR